MQHSASNRVLGSIRSATVVAVSIIAIVGAFAPAHSLTDIPAKPYASKDSSDAPRSMIVEMSGAPRTKATRAGVKLARARRGRVRDLIVKSEGAVRAARGLRSLSNKQLIPFEYETVFNGIAVQISPQTISALEGHPDVKAIHPDRPVRANLDVSVANVRAPTVWQDFGLRGAGVTIAVIDTGVDYTHADLGGCLGAGCKVIGGYDFIGNDPDPIDDHGHGTHVAATAAGNGALLGVAPDASILAYKALDAYGRGSTSTVLAAIELAVDPNSDGDSSDHADIINLSLGGRGDENDPLSTAVDNATSAGVLCVVAAGNAGGYLAIGSPGSARTALTVGAVDDNDALAVFSSRGPTGIAFLAKPEVVAPGVAICAAQPAGAFPGSGCLDDDHASISGTSMATPHVAGAAALLLEARPELSPLALKALIIQSASTVPGDAVSVGRGRLDVRRAFAMSTRLTPAHFSLEPILSAAQNLEADRTFVVSNDSNVGRSYVVSVPPGSFPTGTTVTIDPLSFSLAPGAALSVNVAIDVANDITPNSTTAPFTHLGRVVVADGADEQYVTFSFAKLPRPDNDACADAVEAASLPFFDSIDTTLATSTSDDPATTCACQRNGRSVWYRYTPEIDGVLVARTYGSAYDTVLAAFTGACGSLQQVTCNDDSFGRQSEITVAAVAGVPVLFQVTSFCDSDGGALAFSLEANDTIPVNHPVELFSSSPNDLAYTAVTYTPDEETGTYVACSESASSFPSDPSSASPLHLTDDSSVAVSLALPVPFFGHQQTDLFIGSNGYVTFGEGDTSYSESIDRHFRLPRISALFDDLDPGAGGSVRIADHGDRVAITYAGVPEHWSGGSNDFQIEIFRSGRIRTTYLAISAADGLAGVSPGHNVPPGFAMTDLSAAQACRIPTPGAISTPSDTPLSLTPTPTPTHSEDPMTPTITPPNSPSPPPTPTSSNPSASPTRSPGDEAVELTVEEAISSPGETVDLGIALSVPTDGEVFALDLRIDYDATLLANPHVDTSSAPLGCMVAANTDASDEIRIVGACSHPIAGVGPIVRLSFDVIGTCDDEAAISLSSCVVNEGALACDTVDGSVSIVCGILGRVRYYVDERAVGGVSVALSGDQIDATATASAGDYAFDRVPGGHLRVEPRLQGRIHGAVSALDAAYVLQSVIGLRQLTPQQHLACDVSGNHTTSALDAAQILRYSVGALERFPVAETCGSDWMFLPTADDEVGRAIPPSLDAGCTRGAIAFEPLTGEAAAQDFSAVLFGDCTGNWQPSGQIARLEVRSERRRHRGPRVRFGTLRRMPDGNAVAPVIVVARGYNAFEAQIIYDRSALRLVEARPSKRLLRAGAMMNYREPVPGVINVAIASGDVIRGRRAMVLEFEPIADSNEFGRLYLMRALIDEATPH